MQVPVQLRKRNKEKIGEPRRITSLNTKARGILNTLISRAAARATTTPRNFILDSEYETKVERENVLRQFNDFNLFKKVATHFMKKSIHVLTIQLRFGFSN